MKWDNFKSSQHIVKVENAADKLHFILSDIEVCNPDDIDFWKHTYIIRTEGSTFMAFANHEQDAIDYMIDYCEEQQYNGLVCSMNDIPDEEIDGYIVGGNHCLVLTTNYHITKLL